MAFGSYATLEEALREFTIAVREVNFIEPLPLAVPKHFQERLTFLRQNAPVKASESAICEFLIAPVLQEVWLPHSDVLMIWSHVALSLDTDLKGYPDYFFSRRSPLGPVRDQPYVLFIEAKKDDFDAGWGQCLAAMVAAQHLNARPERTIFGGVTNGSVWYFGKLDDKSLTRDARTFTIDDLGELFAALNDLLSHAKAEVLAAAA